MLPQYSWRQKSCLRRCDCGITSLSGETWEDQGEQIDDTLIADRREDWGDNLPDDVVFITCGVDAEDDRSELEIVGWGRHEE